MSGWPASVEAAAPDSVIIQGGRCVARARRKVRASEGRGRLASRVVRRVRSVTGRRLGRALLRRVQRRSCLPARLRRRQLGHHGLRLARAAAAQVGLRILPLRLLLSLRLCIGMDT